MDIVLALYPGFTALDIVEAFQVLSLLPGARTELVVEKTGPVFDNTGALQLVAPRSFAEVTRPDVILVPGGMVDGKATKTDPLVQWIARVHATTTWASSVCVCTARTYLGLAGLLEGLPATTHPSIPLRRSWPGRPLGSEASVPSSFGEGRRGSRPRVARTLR